MSARPNNRILHVDGDSFFASCEIALNDKLEGRPVWVGGGRRGDGIVIAANRHAKKFGVKTGMACFEAARICPRGVLCKPHYDEYRRLSQEMFRVLEEYSPTLVPASIDEGFLDFTTMDHTVWRNTTAADYVKEICDRIWREVKIPVSAGLASSSRLAKLATDVAKPGFLEIKPGEEKEFLKDRCVRELSGLGKNRQRLLAALGALTFGHVANLPSTLLKQKFGIWGQQLWLFANGRWSEPLMLEVKDRTTISSNTTLPYDEPDYGAALTFALSEATRMTGQLRREQLQLRELSLTIRFNDFSEVSGAHRFQHAQFQNSVINATLEGIFRDIMGGQFRRTPPRNASVSSLSSPKGGEGRPPSAVLLRRTGGERARLFPAEPRTLSGQIPSPQPSPRLGGEREMGAVCGYAQFRPVRQIRIAFWNLARLDTQPTLWGRTDAERWGALDDAAHQLQEQLGKTPLMTGAQLALQHLDGTHKNPKAKCPFVPQREMVKKLWGTDADPLAHKGDWEKRLAKVSKQSQFHH